jgi:hypothetical protein
LETKSGIKLRNITIDYGITTMRELLDAGYSVGPDFAYHEDSGTVMCGLFWGEYYMGELAFFNITELPSFSVLRNKPIDLALLEDTRFVPEEKRADKLYGRKSGRSKLGFRKKIMLTLMIHVIALGLFVLIYATPDLFSFIRNAEIQGGERHVPLGVAIIALPTILISLLWAPFGFGTKFPAPKGKILKKTGFALWVSINLIFSVGCLLAVDYFFSRP